MRIFFVGASGHGKVCAEIAELTGYDTILFLDDNQELTGCGGHRVIGVEDDFRKFVDSTTDFFISIGNCKVRQRIQERIKSSGGNIATLVHPEAIVSRDVELGAGTVIMAGAVINPGTSVGEGTIVNTSSSIDHDCIVGSYSHVAVGSHLCGGVFVGEGSWIGAGVSVNNNIKICSGCMIGAGAVVVKDIIEPGTYIGIPARKSS